jgi:hypothetical protein
MLMEGTVALVNGSVVGMTLVWYAVCDVGDGTIDSSTNSVPSNSNVSFLRKVDPSPLESFKIVIVFIAFPLEVCISKSI